MKITDIRTIIVGNPWKNWVFLQVETDEGLVGLGEATSGLSSKPIHATIEEIKGLVLGLDPRNVRYVRDALIKALYLDTSPAIAGIEIACWDILGRSLNVPVWQLLGGKLRDRVPAYANGWYQGDRTIDSFAEEAAKTVALGYQSLKFDPFGDAYGALDSRELEHSIAIVGAVRETVGPSVDLMIEAHDRFDVDTAIRVGRQLDPFDIRWYEAPTFSTNPDAVGEVARNVGVGVAAGERLTRVSEFPALIRAGVRVLQPEVLNLGVLSVMEASALADAGQLPVAPHNAQSPYSTIVNLHMAAAIPNFLVQEHFDAFAGDWVTDLLSGQANLREGHLYIPEGPGFGVELDAAVAEQHPYSPQNFLRLFRPGWERRDGDRHHV